MVRVGCRKGVAMSAWRQGTGTSKATAGIVVAVIALVMTTTPAAARPKPDVVVLPGATSAEGIALGRGSTFYAGDLFTGDIFAGDLQRGTAELLVDAPDGRQAAGMDFDRSTGLLFVAGGFTGQGYVYDTSTGDTVASYQFAGPGSGALINDVVVTGDGAWFTDSTRPTLYFVPLTRSGPGPFASLALSGPAAAITGQFNLNGIDATANGRTLIVAHTANSALYTVDSTTGASSHIAGLTLANVDGIELAGRRLWAVQNFDNQISVVRLASHLESGVIEHVIDSELFQIPTTAAIHGSKLAVVNGKFDTGFPPNASQYEVVIVDR